MTENRSAHGASAWAAADGHAPLLSDPTADGPPEAPGPAAPDDDNQHRFATAAEEDAYWAGVVDGIHNAGGKPPPRLAARAAKEQLLVEWHDDPEAPPAPAPAEDVLDFAPAHLNPRLDGWTPARQREYVEALADTGVVRAAAARVGMSEQSVNRLRRRAGARGFDAACTAAQRIGARRLVSIAYERAIEGTVKRHYFHGELKAEERVYDNRLLIALINKLPGLDSPDPAADAVAANWEPCMAAIAEGREVAVAAQAQEPSATAVWLDEGDLLTNAPPPAGFALYQEGALGGRHYQRLLTPEEEDYWSEEGEEAARQDSSSTWYLDRPTFFPWGSEPSETPEPSAPDAGGEGAAEARQDRCAPG